MSSDLNLLISSSIFLISASNLSLMLENSVSMTEKSPNLMGMFLLRPLSAIFTCVVLKLLKLNKHWRNSSCVNTGHGVVTHSTVDKAALIISRGLGARGPAQSFK